jgi:thioredoxin 1
MTKQLTSLLLVLALAWSLTACSDNKAEATPDLPIKGMVNMIDLGANQCVPCKMMAPILEEVKAEYKGKAAIVFLDVWKNPAPAKQFKIRVIPTQIFFNEKGEEVLRHEGFMDKKTIVATLAKLGVKS